MASFLDSLLTEANASATEKALLSAQYGTKESSVGWVDPCVQWIMWQLGNGNVSDGDEIEMRFGTVAGEDWTNGVLKEDFTILRETASGLCNESPVSATTVDVVYGPNSDVARAADATGTVRLVMDGQTNALVDVNSKSRLSRLGPFTVGGDYAVRFEHAREATLEPSAVLTRQQLVAAARGEVPNGFSAHRRKQRWSFAFSAHGVQWTLDMTQVDLADTKYEVEAEMNVVDLKAVIKETATQEGAVEVLSAVFSGIADTLATLLDAVHQARHAALF